MEKFLGTTKSERCIHFCCKKIGGTNLNIKRTYGFNSEFVQALYPADMLNYFFMKSIGLGH